MLQCNAMQSASLHTHAAKSTGKMVTHSRYEKGKFLYKKNTFHDVIAAAEHLISEGWTRVQQMTLEGRSAGGMTVGATVNMRPDLFTV